MPILTGRKLLFMTGWTMQDPAFEGSPRDKQLTAKEIRPPGSGGRI
jgi:hypothetical protein